jgi:hypothetical protein
LWTLSESKLDFGRWEAGAPIPAAKTVRLTFDEPATIASPQVGAYDFTGTSAVVEAQRSFDVSISPSVDLPPGHHEITVNVPVRPGVDLKTGAELPMPPGVPSVIHIPLSITRL